MPLASPATPARIRRARLASQPHLAWLFALQGANQNLSAFLIARLDAAHISRNPNAQTRGTSPVPSAAPLTVLAPERVSYQPEVFQRVIRGLAVLHSHYSPS